MAVIDHNLDHVEIAELAHGYGKLTRAAPRPRAQPVQDAIDTIAAELSKRGYILCDCESGNRPTETYDEYQNFLFWSCDKCRFRKYLEYKRGR